MRFPHDVPTLTDGVVTLRAHGEDDVRGVLEQSTDPVSQAWTTGTSSSPCARSVTTPSLRVGTSCGKRMG